MIEKLREHRRHQWSNEGHDKINELIDAYNKLEELTQKQRKHLDEVRHTVFIPPGQREDVGLSD